MEYGLHLPGPDPHVVIERAGGLCVGGCFQRWAPLEDDGAPHVDVANGAVAHLVDCFSDRFGTAQLHAVLDNAVVFARGRNEAKPLVERVRGGLLNIDIFAGLAGPDRG